MAQARGTALPHKDCISQAVGESEVEGISRGMLSNHLSLQKSHRYSIPRWMADGTIGRLQCCILSYASVDANENHVSLLRPRPRRLTLVLGTLSLVQFGIWLLVMRAICKYLLGGDTIIWSQEIFIG